MATRLRQSLAPSTPARSQRGTQQSQRRVTSQQLYEYAPPEFSLTTDAQQALAQLAKTHNLRKLKASLSDGQKYIMDAACDMHERLSRKKQRLADREIDGEMEQYLAETERKTADYTGRLDQDMRKLVDDEERVKSFTASLQRAAEDARAHASTQASIQQMRHSQRRRSSAASDGHGSESDEDRSRDHEFEPTDPTRATQATRAPLKVFQDALESDLLRHQSRSHTERYAENNYYRDYRRVMHDAQHPEGDVPMPHHNQWFEEDGTLPAPGVTNRRGAPDEGEEEEEADDDDDIRISRTKVSTKCPLTLLEFKEPFTSTKCPHSFEKEAILSMIKQNRGQPIQCPVGACREMLQAKDLHADAVLIRQIKRLQLARQMEEEEGDDESQPHGTQRNGLNIDDMDEDDDDDDDDDNNNHGSTMDRRIAPKREARGSAPASSVPGPAEPIHVDSDHNDHSNHSDESDEE